MPAHHQADRKRILFVGESVTLAHVVRPMVMARGLDPARYQIIFACDDRYLKLFDALPGDLRPLRTIPSRDFLENLAKGKAVYDKPTLRDYVRSDLELLESTRPDLVVGDFRISLGISARLCKVPYVTITNAYWSPYSRLKFPLPEHPITRVFGVGLSEWFFSRLQPTIFALHAQGLNTIRREYGLPSLGGSLQKAYTDADLTLYADIPAFVPTTSLPANHQWLGPILWSPDSPRPDWWDTLPEDRPIVYVALGSSGDQRILPRILQGLAALPVTVIAATSGRTLNDLPDNALTADFLPGIEAAARSSLMICNGGSLSTQQALAAGVPILGIADNMDQYLNMMCVEKSGTGTRMRAGQVSPEGIARLASQLLEVPDYAENAQTWARIVAEHDTGLRFERQIRSLL
ncbi:glycosyltransferase [Ectothiorhodospira lacustris]|uniref:glycosyltransferase n=1 Tax=Ectothiorhodospira lacustris TaxID=2899127 RepID=UPI001EE9AE3C|nr:glycosyltransferase [Ectothiorhodospira lacustris]MCG5501099.1 glycosyltransferase [Ectothiorhodospira lacustris]MCG5510845.1 glycosyltransferase [Ectothiorhodospira lacustris]MCG5522609.1 glycosyltransferase [Ectothiorhodospira lacustris]